MTTNLGSAEAAAREAGKSIDREDDRRHAREGEAPPRWYVVHNADAIEPAANSMGRTPLPPSLRSQGMLDRTLQGQIGRMLRDVFSDVAEEPVPERFVALLEALAVKEKQP